MRAKLVITLLGLGAFVLLSLLPLLLRPHVDADRRPALDARDPEAIDLTTRGEHIAALTNTAPLMSLLRSGKHVESHLCTFQGTLFFHFSNGDSNCVDILPGHTNTNYEFVCSNGYFAVPRSAFLNTLAQAGVDTNVMPMK